MRGLINPRVLWTSMKTLGGTALLVFALGVPVQSQTEFSGLPGPGVPAFDLDVAAFRQTADSARLEIYYRITNPHLSYIKKGDEYIASYEISAVLKGDRDQQAASATNTEKYIVTSYDETRRTSGYLINVLTMTAREGQYDLLVTVNDRVSGGTHTVHRPVDLRDFGSDDWVFGGPEFFIPDAPAPRQERYLKDTLALVPNVTRTVGGGDSPLSMYFEVYSLPRHPVQRVIVRLSQQAGHHRLTDTLAIDTSLRRAPVLYRTPLKGFEGGDVRMELQAIDGNGRPVGNPRDLLFSIDWSLLSLLEGNWNEMIGMLVHIATHDEMETLKKTPPEDRAAALEQFWKSKDPSPESEENEWKQEYYRRIQFANQQYTTPFQPGWRTDFGTVYIKYGEPDEVERFPFEIGRKPYEIWYYYAQRRQFVFVDAKGNGEYELQYPYDGIVR